ncbi:MAG: NADH-quinone oxidoreductase subunit NuoK [Deltaproteobacteria bacterium CG11_big_fil_rev_8_21_14_0_20_42_23]|nr:MAG: NADH-quinone oxidoreductase subunit NuoK [Deltaproteobacteria bacterium CG11_big_fil_rev_8_21_14_0_20_42_23]PJC64744.1 MAG: NADH-quinone oxidoreductase subunit NuoK [Deltaproteobacteria bacterium CG_4_9_14_0_2_um_filter_42_21]
MITLHHYLILSLALFVLGAIGVVIRRNVLIMFMSVELMLNAVNIVLLAFSKWNGRDDGHVMVLFVLAIAAAEAAVGLGIVIAMYRNKQTVYSDDMKVLKG